MHVSKNIFPALPRWLAWTYMLLGLITAPWTIYLAITLPEHHLSTHWDVSWVGLDIAIIIMLILNGIYVYRESRWLIMSATATMTLLTLDAWFDITTARKFHAVIQAIILAIFIELPLAFITFRVALRMMKRGNFDLNRKGQSRASKYKS